MTASHRSAGDQFVVLPISILKVDRSYQRRYDHALAKRVVAENGGTFDLVKAGPILVNKRRKGGYYIVDGQHRVGMATEAGEAEVIAELLDGLTPKEEAELRVARHSRKADNALELFQARLSSGDKGAQALVAALAKHGAQLAAAQDSPITHLRAVKTLEGLYEASPIRFHRILSIISRAYGRIDRNTGNSYMLKGLDWMLRVHDGTLDEDRLVRRLGHHTIQAIDNQALIFSAAGGTRWKNYYRVLTKVYNTRTPRQLQLMERH